MTIIREQGGNDILKTMVENQTELNEQIGQNIVQPTFYSKIMIKMVNCKKQKKNVLKKQDRINNLGGKIS